MGDKLRGASPEWQRPAISAAGVKPLPMQRRFGRTPSQRATVVRLSERVRGQLEFLDALSGIDLGSIDAAFGIDRHGMDPVKLPGVAAVVAEGTDHDPILAVQDS